MPNNRIKITIVGLISLLGCSGSDKTESLQSQIDSLKIQLAKTYKPGFGECMSHIQRHHEKLWFAGQNKNWKLADFEIHEIEEALEDIEKYQSDRAESRLIGILKPDLDSLKAIIQAEDPVLFSSGFVLLTNNCNSCHRATNFGFNVVKVPEHLSFPNQEFKPGSSHGNPE